MRNPNFLVLDEPTNDLDIMTLNVLEEYLRTFKGCVIVVSHDRYFMDKVVDHLLVFKGNAELKDFPGNYTDYRDWQEAEDAKAKELALQAQKKEAAKQQNSKPAESSKPDNSKKKLSFKEKREFETLEIEIPQLEEEKAKIEEELSSGTLSTDELLEKSNRISVLIDEIDEKTMRWLELSEM